jgi:hypothetical protein
MARIVSGYDGPEGSDLPVVGSRDPGPFPRLPIGSGSHHGVARVPRPAVAVRPGTS